MNHLLRSVSVSFLLLSFFTACQQTEEKKTTILCITGDATDITSNSAVLKGSVAISNGPSDGARVYFLIGDDSSTLEKEGSRHDAELPSSAGGNVSVTVTGLHPGTEYYFIVVASAAGEQGQGEISSFSTLKDKIVTDEASNITETTAILHGYANLLQGDSGEFGICYSADRDEMLERWQGVKSTLLDSNNMFSVSISGLTPATTYYYSAFYSWNGQKQYGEIKSFSTADFSVNVNTLEATGVGFYEATLNGSLSIDSSDDLPKEVYFHYSSWASSLDFLIPAGETLSSSLKNDGTFSSSLSSLDFHTTYYYVACVSINDREYHGEIKSFTTPDYTASAVAKTVKEFIELKDKNTYYKLTGIVSGFNEEDFTFYITDDTGSIFVYDVLERYRTEWKDKISDGGIITLAGKYHFYMSQSKPEVVSAAIHSFESGVKGTGTLNDPFNGAGAVLYIKQHGNAETEKAFYVYGKIAEIEYNFIENTGTASFYISDNGKAPALFRCKEVLYLNNKAWKTGDSKLQVGDDIIVCGTLTYANAFYETVSNKAFIYSLNGKTSNE